MKKSIPASTTRRAEMCGCGCEKITSDYYLHYIGNVQVLLARDCFERELSRETRADSLPAGERR